MDNLETNSKIVLDKLQQLLKKFTTLQKEQASSGQMTHKDQKEFEKKISQYIKEIDKCIGILSE